MINKSQLKTLLETIVKKPNGICLYICKNREDIIQVFNFLKKETDIGISKSLFGISIEYKNKFIVHFINQNYPDRFRGWSFPYCIIDEHITQEETKKLIQYIWTYKKLC